VTTQLLSIKGQCGYHFEKRALFTRL